MHWMYLFERLMKILKGYVRNWNLLEGCIVECYIADEAIEFCSVYIRNPETISVPKPHDSGSKGIGVGNQKLLVRDDLEQTHRIVLEYSIVVQPYI